MKIVWGKTIFSAVVAFMTAAALASGVMLWQLAARAETVPLHSPPAVIESDEEDTGAAAEPDALYESGSSFGATSTTDLEASEKPAPDLSNRLSVLPDARPGEVVYFQGDLPEFQIAAVAIIELDEKKSPGVVLATNGSIEVFHFTKTGGIEKVWSAEYSEKYQERGFAAAAFQGSHKGTNLLFVSINKFAKAFAYKWNGKEIAKAGRISGAIADVTRKNSVSLVTNYGKGVISFDGSATKLVDTSGKEPQYFQYPIKGDYFAACVMSWNRTSPKLSVVAAVSENGEINVFKEGIVKYKTLPSYGAQLVCDNTPQSGDVLYATTSSSDQDSVLTLDFREDELVETWRTGPFDGAVTALAAGDLDRDGNTELIGVYRSKTGAQKLFRLKPLAPKPPAPPPKKTGTKQR